MTRTSREAPSPASALQPATAPDQVDESPVPAAPHPAVPVHAELGPIIRSKIQAPVLRESTLTRPRLIDALVEATQRRLTLLIAEAGYGKTTLMADFAVQTGIRTLWFRLDPTDADVVTWTNHIIAAVREVEPTFGQATLDLIAHLPAGGPPRSAYMSSVIGELGRLDPVQTVLVLDDFHAVDESAEANEFVSRLAKEAPPWLSIVVSARRRPSVELGRLRARGEISEIATDDLRFSGDEIVALFTDTYGVHLEDDVVLDLRAKTQGWVASLQLFHGSIRGKSGAAIRDLVRTLSGASDPIYDFLAEEVLSSLPEYLDEFLVRASVLELIGDEYVVALFEENDRTPSIEQAQTWIGEADRLALLSRSSQSSELRMLHPLLQDFLRKQLDTRLAPADRAAIHSRVARRISNGDPLAAVHHFLEAGEPAAAMDCLGRSVMLTMGTGQWGKAVELVDRIDGVPTDPAVAAVRARLLMEQGDLLQAAALLEPIDLASSPSDIRAVVRHARLSLGWRTGDRELMFATMAEAQEDADPPPILGDILQVHIDTSPMASFPLPFAALAGRLEAMSKSQREAGYAYYAAISLHNAAIAYLAAGRYREAIRLAEGALGGFEALPFGAPERYSTHVALTNAWLELGDAERVREHMALALSSGEEHADVPAEVALLLAAIGERDRAESLLLTADALETNGLSDFEATCASALSRALLAMGTEPQRSVDLLDRLPNHMPLDVGSTLRRDTILGEALLLSGLRERASDVIGQALVRAGQHAARTAQTRLAIVQAMADMDGDRLRAAVTDASGLGNLGLLETADIVASGLSLIIPTPSGLADSIQQWPGRWLPVLRRQLLSGPTANARAAAELLDAFGSFEDILRLRAYSKTYAPRGRARPNLGRTLARRVAPMLELQDLGRVRLRIATREFALSAVRRKPAALLMYLVTRPNLTATREQVLDQMWPESDPVSANNSLNQSLYFLRREIDPWYEDDVSVDYVRLQGDLVWLDPDLTRASSVEMLKVLRVDPNGTSTDAAIQILSRYTGQFAPEFEYEEWAIAWRSRLHASYLAFAMDIVTRLLAAHSHADARDLALRVLETEPDATDIEICLIRAYWETGAQSAAIAQYAHLEAQSRVDGLDLPPLNEVVRAPH